MTKIQTNRVALICKAFVLIFLCVCFMGNANVFSSENSNQTVANSDAQNATHIQPNTNKEDTNIEIVSIDIDCQDVKDISASEMQHCIDTINALKRIARTDELDALDHAISNTDTSKNVVKQIQEHYKEIKKAARETKQDEELQDEKLTREDYLQILEILEEIIKLNGIYVIPNTDNGDSCILIPASRYVWEKFIELVVVRKYVKMLEKNNIPLGEEDDTIHATRRSQINTSYRRRAKNGLYKYKNTPNADIIKNIFTSNNNADANTAHNAIRSLEIHHIFPRSLLGPSIFANYAILTQANHALVHVSDVYKELEKQEATDRENGIASLADKLADKIIKSLDIRNNGNIATNVSEQLRNRFRNQMAALVRVHNTYITIKYNIDGILHALMLQKQDL